MILCPNCLHKELLGALFCSECGAQILLAEGDATTDLPQQDETLLEAEPPVSTTEPAVPMGWEATQDGTLSLKIIGQGEIIHISERNEITLGRTSKGQPIIPDIDLGPYNAYESGVSRMHLSLKVGENQAKVTDLGSANGTRINGRKISAHTPHPIKNGDILTLGKLKIQVLFNP